MVAGCGVGLHSGFQYATTLTCAHLAITGLFLHFARILRMFEYKTLELRPLLIFSVLNGISIGEWSCLSAAGSSVGYPAGRVVTLARRCASWLCLCCSPSSVCLWALLSPFPIGCFRHYRCVCVWGCCAGFLNLSLGFNSVGFYQMTKLAIIPCTVMLQGTFYGRKFSAPVKWSLGVCDPPETRAGGSPSVRAQAVETRCMARHSQH